MVNPSSPPIPRSCDVSSSLVWTPSVSSGIITSSSAGDGQYRPPTGFIGDPHLQKERHPHPTSLRHPFQQHAYTIVDPQHQQNAPPQQQGNTISQSMFNQMYNSQTRNAKMPFSQGLEFNLGGNYFSIYFIFGRNLIEYKAPIAKITLN